MAHHKAVSHQFWQNALRIECDRWRGKEMFNETLERLKSGFLPQILKHTESLSGDARILEIGSGAVCVAKLVPQGEKTYIDPLLDDFRRNFPGELPEGELITAMGEDIPKPDQSFDCIICMNVLGYVMNPELVLNEIDRLLRPGGCLLIGMTLFSPLKARIHYWMQRVYPAFSREDRPYCYSLHGIRKTLSRHYNIREDIRIGGRLGFWPGLKREEHFFVCTRPEPKSD